MTRTIEEKLVIDQPAGSDFFKDAIREYGREGAKDMTYCDS